MLALLWVFCQVFLFSSFRIPSDSMEPEVIAGDNVLVFKPTIGARLFNIFEVGKKEQPQIYRLPGLKRIKRNDLLVFNFPHPTDWSKIELNLMSYYIKRCIGMPGDSLSIVNGFYKVRGIDLPLGNMASQQYMNKSADSSFDENVFRSFPYDSVMAWNIKNFGPLYIPKEGAEIQMNRKNYVLYKKLIEWEQQEELTWQDSVAVLGGKPIVTYSFRKNYYFMAGDRVEDSQDSRYWGLLPEEYIVGKAWIVWKSTDPFTGKFRWNRFLKRLK